MTLYRRLYSTVCRGFMKFVTEFLYKTLEGEREFRENRCSISHYTCLQIWIFTLFSVFFLPFLMKFGIDDLHVSSIICEFRENWHRKGCTLLKGVNAIIIIIIIKFDFSSHSFKTGVEGILKPLSDCEFRISVCCQKPCFLKNVNERPDFLRPVSVKFCGCPQKIVW